MKPRLEEGGKRQGLTPLVPSIGEAARNIARNHPDFAALHAEVPWEDVYLMRNRVAHGYFSVDLEIVWRTVQRDLPELERQVLRLKQDDGR